MKLFAPVRVRDADNSDRDDDRGGNCRLPPLSSSQRNAQSPEASCVNCSFLFSYPAYLDEITGKLNSEDPSTRPLRRALGFMDILKKVRLSLHHSITRQSLILPRVSLQDLIPILLNSKDQPDIFRATLK